MRRLKRNMGSRISRLVWALAAVGLAAQAITFGMEQLALTRIRAERSAMKEIEGRALASLRRFQRARETVIQDLELHFQTDAKLPPLNHADPMKLISLHAQCEADLAELTDDHESMGSSLAMREAILTLAKLHHQLKHYIEKSAESKANLDNARSQFDRDLVQMQEAVEKMDGRRRLRQEVLLRQYRNGRDADPHAITTKLITEFNSAAGFRVVLSELNDLELLGERLRAVDDPVQLVSLKDNEFRQTFNRLYREAERVDELHGAHLTQQMVDIRNALFGIGSLDDPAHQTLIAGRNGLFSLTQEQMALAAQRRELRAAVVKNSQDCIEYERLLDRQMFSAIKHSSLQAETTLRRAWRDSLLAGAIVFATFLVLSWRTARLGRQFEVKLRSKNEELEATMEQLRVATRDAQEASRSKSEFLANMSHEIRTPMTAILGFTDSMLDPDLSDDRKHDAIHTIRRNGTHLLQIINDILDMSKIEAGRMEVERIATNPVKIVEEVASLMRPQAQDKGLYATVRYDSPIPEQIFTDPTRLRQILLNLVGNAIKFTEAGGVTLHAECLPNESLMRFRVVDTGLGMTPEQTEQIERFDAFSQADGTTTRRFGGTGLGLRISNSLARILGGGIRIRSETGSGSTFTVTVATGDIGGVSMICPERIPGIAEHLMHDHEEASARVTGDSPLRNLNILVAEDGPDNQRLISHHLRRAGANVSLAANGRIAVHVIEQAVDGESFNVVLMDMQMPELDGYDATLQLRRAGHTVPIIALTAHAMSGDREKCLSVGCNDYLTKPIDRTVLISKCHDWARKVPVLQSNPSD